MSTVAGSTPYEWPFDGVIDASRTALVIAGADADSVRSVPAHLGAERQIARLRSLLGSLGVLVVLVHHDLPRRLPSARREASQPLASPGETVVIAVGFDGFYGSALDSLLHRRGRTHLILAGYGFESMVHSTMRRANDRGYECVLVTDAVLCVDPNLHRSAASQIEMSGGIFGAVASADAVLDAYRSTSAAPTSGREQGARS